MKKIYKYLFFGLTGVILISNSIYFQDLDEVIAERNNARFDPKTYANTAWKRLMDNAEMDAYPIQRIVAELGISAQQTCDNFGRTLGIGNKCFYLLKGQGIITGLDDEHVFIENADQGYKAKIATQFIFGSTIREASGQVPIGDFASIMNFNKVAEAMNNRVLSTIIPPFLNTAKEGVSVRFIGAAAIRKDKPFTRLTLIPIALTTL